MRSTTLAQTCRRSRAENPPVTAHRFRIEPLEDRIAPASLIWDGSDGDGNWFNPQNWNGNAVPGSSDTAILNINSTINLTASATVAAFQQTAGIFDGAGSLTITGDLAWSGGMMAGTGNTTVTGTASMISGAAGKTLNRTLINGGTLSVSLADISAGIVFGTTAAQPGHLTNLAGGTVNVTAGGDFVASSAQNSSIENAGQWNVMGAAATTSSVGTSIAFKNTGTLNVASGEFELNGGGTNSANIAVGTNATLDFAAGTYAVDAGSAISGGGTLAVSGGVWNFNAGSYNIAATLVNGGTANFEAAASTTALTVSSGTLAGAGALSVIGNLTWNGGIMSGAGSTKTDGAGSTIAGAGSKFLNRTLINSGTLAVNVADSGGGIVFGTTSTQPGHLINLGNGIVNVTSGGDFVASSAQDSTIDNAGAWNVTGIASNTSSVGSTIAFNNTGTLNVNSGIFELNGGGTNTAALRIASGATLDFGGDTYVANAGSAISGLGTLSVSAGVWSFNAGSYSIVTTQISGGTANFESAATTTALILSNGTLAGAGSFSVTANLSWSAGTMSGSGNTTINGAGSTVTGGAGKFLNRTLINSGTLAVNVADTGGGIVFGTIAAQAGHLVNLGTGIVNVTAGGDFIASSAQDSTIDNAGRWNITGPAATTSSVGSSIAFNNTGTLNIGSGSLQLTGGGTNTSRIVIASGATLDIAGDTFNANAGSDISGAGKFLMSGGTLNFNAGSYSIMTTEISAGNANFEGTATTFTLNFSGGVFGGAGVFSVAGNLAWTGGTMNGNGTINVFGPGSTISGGSTKFLNRTLVNNGTLDINVADSGGGVVFGTTVPEPGHLINVGAGVVNVTAGGDFIASSAQTSTIDNAGAWNITGAPSTVSSVGSSIAFNNTGTLNVASGTFELNGGGTNTRNIVVASGATLDFGGDSFDANPGTDITGTGKVLLSGGVLNFKAGRYSMGLTEIDSGIANFDGAATTAALTLSGGTLAGAGVLNVMGNLAWSGGTMSGTGSTNVAGAGSTISGGTKFLNRTLMNSGVLAVNVGDNGGGIVFGTTAGLPGHLVNLGSGVVNVTAGGDFIASSALDSSIDNSGTWNISGGPATISTVGSTIAFKNTGTLNIVSGQLNLSGDFLQSAGSTRLSGGLITSGPGMTFTGGQIGGTGRIIGNVANNGATFQPGDGSASIFHVEGNYTQGPLGILEITIGGTDPGVEYDQLLVSGTTSLGGKLVANSVNGYVPAVSDVLSVVVTATRTGVFSSVSAPGTLGLSYTPTEARLVVGATPTISIDSVTLAEGTAGTESASFRVTLSTPSTQTVTVQYATDNGTATAPEDYIAVGLTTLTFPPGEVSKLVDIQVRGDVFNEPDETFLVLLSSATNATLADAQGVGTIVNDDNDNRLLSISNASIAEGNSGIAMATFTVSLSTVSDLPISVGFATADGTAIAGEDYVAVPLTTLTFSAGELSKFVTVAINGDAVVEPTEYFAVLLSNPTNATLFTSAGGGAIRNDDFDQSAPGKMSFPEPDGDVVTITLNGQTLGAGNVVLADDGSIASIDLTSSAAVLHAVGGKPLGLTIAAKTPGGGQGDGLTKVGLINAGGISLGKVSIEGDLGQIMAGTGSGKTALKSLSVAGNLGFAVGASRLSELLGGIKQLKVGGSVQKSAVQVSGKVNSVAILGDLIGLAGLSLGVAELDHISKSGLSGYVAEGNALPAGMLLADIIGSLRVGGSVKAGAVVTTKDLGSFSVLGDFAGGGLFSDGGIKVVKIAGRVSGDDASAPATITARSKLTSLVINGDVENARILAGYSKDEVPVNADAQIGKVVVKGNWSASSLVAGIEDTTSDGFGRNDAVIASDSTPSVVSKIARVVIKGAATGSAVAGDHFGITAQEIGSLSISGSKVPLGKGVPDDVLLDEANADFRVVEVG